MARPLPAKGMRRVWSAVRISWYLTNLLHRFPGASDFDQRAQEHELQCLRSSHHAQAALAEQYAGLPLEEAAWPRAPTAFQAAEAFHES